MKPIIIACKTIEDELLAAMERASFSAPILWLDSGLHNVPKKLNAVIQEHLDNCVGYDTVLLGLSLCGNSILGLRTHDFQLVVPRCDDCISLLLGDSPRPFATLFLTRGWLKGGQHLGQEYDNCLKKYGEKRGKRIFDAMLKNYRHVALLDTGCFDILSAEGEIRAIGEKLGLQYTRLQGSTNRLEALFRGAWTERDFILVPPNSVLTNV